MPDSLPQQFLSSDVLASAALLFILVAARLLVGRALRRRENLPSQVIRRWTANARNLLLLVALVGLVMIWAPQLRTFALSLTAFAVALVVAMKELILCLSGSALRTFSRAYSVGDYVEIGGKRGEVLDHSLLVTRLKEFDKQGGSFPGVRREIVLPHSLLFSSAIRVEGSIGGRIRHAFPITFEPDANLFAARDQIEEVALEAYRRVAARHRPPAGGTQPKTRVDRSAERPVHITFGTTEIGKYRLDIETLAEPELIGETEQAIVCAVGDVIHRLRTESTSDSQTRAAASDRGT